MPRDPLAVLAAGRLLLGRFRVVAELDGEPGVHVASGHDEGAGGRPVVLRVPTADALARPGFDRAVLIAARGWTDGPADVVDRPLARGLVDAVPVVVHPVPAPTSWAALFPPHASTPLDRRGVPAASELVVPLTALARAVDALHAAGHVHRCLGSTSIAFDGAMRAHFVAPVFASARAAVAGEADAARAAVHRAPETLADGVFTAASDRFAVACLAFEAVVRQPVARIGLDGADRLAREALERLPGELGTVLATALDADPSRRHPSCVAFAEAVAHAVSRLETPQPHAGDARPGLAQPRRRGAHRPAHADAGAGGLRPPRRQRARGVLLAGIAVALVLGFGAFLRRGEGGRRAEEAAAVRGRDGGRVDGFRGAQRSDVGRSPGRSRRVTGPANCSVASGAPADRRGAPNGCHARCSPHGRSRFRAPEGD